MTRISEYSEEVVYGHPEEYHLYTWMNATLRELTNVVKSIIPAANRKDARVVFYHVYQDTSGRSQFNPGRFKRKELGTIQAVKRGADDGLTLKNGLFEVGDILDIDIQTSSVFRRTYN